MRDKMRLKTPDWERYTFDFIEKGIEKDRIKNTKDRLG